VCGCGVGRGGNHGTPLVCSTAGCRPRVFSAVVLHLGALAGRAQRHFSLSLTHLTESLRWRDRLDCFLGGTQLSLQQGEGIGVDTKVERTQGGRRGIAGSTLVRLLQHA
jgi:hypothetical protein